MRISRLAALVLALPCLAGEEQDIAILRSNAPATEKAAACRTLARTGTRQAVPALAPLLADKDLSHMARLALEPIQDPAVDEALRNALGHLQGDLLTGVISSIASRKDAGAVDALAQLLKHPEAPVAQAAARALGHIGTPAIPKLTASLTTAPATLHPAIAGALIAASATAPADAARPLFAQLRALPNLPLHLRTAILRGCLATAGADAPALLAAEIRTASYVPAATAIGLANEFPAADITRTLTDALPTAAAPTQALLLATLGCRSDASAVPAIMPLTTHDSPEIRIAAIAALAQMAPPTALPTLASAVNDPVPDVAQTALEALAGFPGKEADAACLALLTSPPPAIQSKATQILRQRIPNTRENIGQPDSNGFTPIFNGKDLIGWSGKPGWWSVEDGALTAESTPEKPATACNYLIWRGDLPADFELLADFKLSAQANSGIQIRSQERLDWDTYGYQADMTDDGSLIGFVYHHQRGLIAARGENATFAPDGTKSVTPLGDPAELLTHYKTSDWNTYHIVCQGPEIRLSINGTLMCKITDHHASEAAKRGIIALQMHPGPPMKAQFKNIRIKSLAPPAPAR